MLRVPVLQKRDGEPLVSYFLFDHSTGLLGMTWQSNGACSLSGIAATFLFVTVNTCCNL